MIFDVEFAIECFGTAVSGIPTTLLMTLGSLLVAVPLGFLVAVTRVNRVPVLRQIAALYVSFVRGTPVIVQIFIIYSVLPGVFKSIVDANGWNIDIYGINPIWYAILIFGFNTATHFSEIFRSSLLSVPAGQREAAYACGFSTFQTYWRFIIPQAFVIAAPSFCTSSMNMLKNTSLAYMIGVMDLTGRAKAAAGIGYRYFEAYVDIFIVYLIVCLAYEQIFKRLAARVGRFRNQTAPQQRGNAA